MPFDTLIFDPSPCGFPKPYVSLLPTGCAGLTWRTAKPWAPREHFRHFARGRYALHQACRLAGIGPGNALLAPAYHCRTMIDPALALDGDVLLYPLTPDLSPDLAALESLTENSATPVKALLATHFFGRPQSFASLAEWSRSRGIVLIEDCSHCFLTAWHRPARVGCYGDFVIGSPYKFLPSPDGGLLYAPNPAALETIEPNSPAWFAELRGGAAFLRQAVEHGRIRIPPDLDAANPADSPIAIERRERTGCSPDYLAAQETLGAQRLSEWIGRHADTAGLAHQRRDHYLRWVKATADLPFCRPLFPALPTDCIPYMFPLLIDRPAKDFYALKQAGMPIWRWDSQAVSNCPTAQDYRLRLLHLPCHQALDESELDWMMALIAKLGAGGMKYPAWGTAA